MRRLFWIGSVLTCCASTMAQEALPSVDASVQPVIKRGLVYLEDRGVNWKQEFGCASCHHAPMMVWSMNEAKIRGYSVNETVLDEMTTWLMDETDPAGLLPAKPDDIRAVAAGYPLAAVTMPEGLPPVSANPGAHYVRYLLDKQMEEGPWPPLVGRLPVMASQRESTLLAAAALAAVPMEPESPDAMLRANSLERVKSWLAGQGPLESSQERNYGLLLLLQTAASVEEIRSLTETIVAEQRPDGGWAQTLDRASDAFATGQTLYVLARTNLAFTGVLGRGVQFLTSTQAEDGSWPMTSRPMEPDSGMGTNSEPITYAGSAWAVLGLLRTSPAIEPASSEVGSLLSPRTGVPNTALVP